jgi:hypothetical protein
MALTDVIEYYGRAIVTGEMSRDAALAALVKSSKGGLTPVGAEQAIADWQSSRLNERLPDDLLEVLDAL